LQQKNNNNILTYFYTFLKTFTEKVFSRGLLTYLTPLFISFSTFGGLSGAILSTSRMYYAAARDGNLPEMFSMININFFSPINSIVLMVSSN
jgi:amino acid transporter